jgi:hypothetical protein
VDIISSIRFTLKSMGLTVASLCGRVWRPATGVEVLDEVGGHFDGGELGAAHGFGGDFRGRIEG